MPVIPATAHDLPGLGALVQTRPAIRRRGLRSLVADGLRDLVSNRRLIPYLVGAEPKRTHADTVLGQI